MDRIYIIGNGFDCAHQLPTRYLDFINWYVRDSFLKAIDSGSFSNENFDIVMNNSTVKDFWKDKNVSDFNEFREDKVEPHFGIQLNPSLNKMFSWRIKSEFIKKLIDNCLECGWVDIEKEFYLALKLISGVTQVVSISNNESIKSLNSNFEKLRDMLVEYIKTIDCKNINYSIQNLLNLNSLKHKEIPEPRTFLIINFNYTNTIEKYLNFEWPDEGIGIKYELLYIHGNVLDAKYPIIFGYGDETDKYFTSIEELDNYEFVKHFKSDGYGLNPNYRIISKFIDTTDYEVHILGHSCGSSDRVLLKAIFDNPHCKQIKIFHHERDDGTSDFMDIYRNISRCFSVNNRHVFKSKTVSYEKINQIRQK